MRVVLDTNILISAFLWQGAPKDVFMLAEKGGAIICVSGETIDEFERILSYPKFAERLARLGKTPADVIDELLGAVEYYPSHSFPAPQIRDDPADDIFLACALAADADFIISGDEHLLALKSFQNIPILTPRQFLNQLKK